MIGGRLGLDVEGDKVVEVVTSATKKVWAGSRLAMMEGQSLGEWDFFFNK
jgi:hypothetical protein